MTIETENLRLISCDSKVLKSAMDGNNYLSELLGVTVADKWLEFGVGTLQYSLDKLSKSSKEIG